MLEIILAISLGILAGTITGLMPGLHTNTIAFLIITAGSSLLLSYNPLTIAVFLVSMIVVHSFVDFIPSIFLGAPEAATVLSLLPGHELLLQGRGFQALRLTIIGGIGTFILSIFFIPIIFIFLESLYNIFKTIIGPILFALSVIFILQEKEFQKIIWAIIIFILAGTLGMIVLNEISLTEPLFPLLSGLFGVSTLFLSMFGNNTLIKQNIDSDGPLISKKYILSYFKAAISSLIVSIMPAIGAAQAAIISRAFTKFKDKEEFLVVIGGINTAATIFTLTTLFVINKARTGVSAVIKDMIQLSLQDYLILILTCFVALVFGVNISLKLGKLIALNISKIKYRKMSLIVIIFIVILVICFSGLLGLFILIVATSIGMLAPLTNVRRIHLMSVLIIPVIFYFI
jgi:putative membrane protein